MTPREVPILFSGPMVRAILGGRKTQTRRVVTDRTSRGNWRPSQCDLSQAWVDPGPSIAGNPGPYLKAPVLPEALAANGWSPQEDSIVDRIYPWVFAGDRIWVRETWSACCGHGAPFCDSGDCAKPEFDYRATNDVSRPHGWDNAPDDAEAPRWRPSIHMPRAASRISLEVTRIGLERVQDISEDDARAEGFSSRDEFFTLFFDVNKRAPRSDSPWVWIVEFRRAERAGR